MENNEKPLKWWKSLSITQQKKWLSIFVDNLKVDNLKIESSEIKKSIPNSDLYYGIGCPEYPELLQSMSDDILYEVYNS